MEKILNCIDDTDNLDSIGTGEVLENLCDELTEKHLAENAGFVTRHQLFIHEDIAYTSHNSSMCCEMETDDVDSVVKFCRDYMANSCAEGSDPGLCVYIQDKCDSTAELMEFGRKAKETVLQKQQAYDLAEKYRDCIYLSEHGGTGDGVIGAIAGIGLRLTGNDGRIKGKIRSKTPNEIMTIAQFCEKYGIQQALTLDDEIVPMDAQVRFEGMTKAVYKNYKVTAIMIEKDGMWAPKPKEKKDRK